MHKRCFRLTAIGIVSLALSGAAGVLRATSQRQAEAQVSISGRVTDSGGVAIEGATVTLVQMIYAEAAFVPEPKVVDEKTTAADGSFTLVIPQAVDPKKGSYVVARKAGLSLGWAPWRMPGGQRVEIPLGQAGDLAGEVVDEQGQPVPDAEVRIAAASIRKDRTWDSLPIPEFLHARTDDGGRFLFADMPADGSFEFLVEKPGRALVCTLYRTASLRDGCQFAPGQTGIRVISPPEAAIEGVAVDSQGGDPIAGASIVALATSGRRMAVSPRPVVTTQDGTFRIGGLVAGEYAVGPIAPLEQMGEWAAEPAPVALKTGETARGIKLELARGGVLEVSVREPSGRPVAKAAVDVYTVRRDQDYSGVTDANGVTRIRVTAGVYQVTGVFKDGYARPLVREEESITVADGQTIQVECTLVPSKAAGIVRDQAGRPLAGVQLAVLLTGKGEAVSDFAGRFQVNWGAVPFMDEDAGFVLVARDVTRDLALAVDLSGQSLDSLDFRLQPGVTVAGTVLDQQGKPLPGARVCMEMQGTRWLAYLTGGEAIAGPDGTFEIKTIPPNRQYMVTARADGHGCQEIPFPASDAKDNRRDVGRFRLPGADLSITGVVVDPNGKPVAQARVRGYARNQPEIPDVRTDSQGRFVIQGVCEGPVEFRFNAVGQSDLHGFAVIEAGATDVRIVISEQPSDRPYVSRRPASLTGKVTPPLRDLGLDLPGDAEGKRLLVCFWDVGQRPSRNCVTQLAARAAELGEKGVVVAIVQSWEVEGDALNQWVKENKIPFQIGRITGNAEKTRFAWGVVSLPHLVLTNKEHIVVAEDFGLGDLDKQIEMAAGR